MAGVRLGVGRTGAGRATAILAAALLAMAATLRPAHAAGPGGARYRVAVVALADPGQAKGAAGQGRGFEGTVVALSHGDPGRIVQVATLDVAPGRPGTASERRPGPGNGAAISGTMVVVTPVRGDVVMVETGRVEAAGDGSAKSDAPAEGHSVSERTRDFASPRPGATTVLAAGRGTDGRPLALVLTRLR